MNHAIAQFTARTRLRLACLTVLAGAAAGLAQSEPEGKQRHQNPTEADRAQGRRVEFVPGVVIDWGRGLVEVDAVVVLRDAPLELLACSPDTREHESIVVVPVRPLHIFQAMGLIGLEPGSPVSYDRASRTWKPPTGDPLDISVRYSRDGEEVTVPVHHWLARLPERKPVEEKIDWVFAGSQWADGKMVGEGDGTIVCVVNFDTALIAVADLHTSSNESLWLAANPKTVPAVGTKCRLIIGPDCDVRLELDREGKMRSRGRELSPEDVRKLVSAKSGHKAGARVVLRVHEDMPAEAVEKALERLARAGVERARIEVDTRPSEPEEPAASGPEAEASENTEPPRKREPEDDSDKPEPV